MNKYALAVPKSDKGGNHAKGFLTQSHSAAQAANKVAQASRLCVFATGDNFTETHRRDACATTSPENRRSAR